MGREQLQRAEDDVQEAQTWPSQLDSDAVLRRASEHDLATPRKALELGFTGPSHELRVIAKSFG